MASNDKIPIEFLCVITKDIMVDPVICEDGFTYERSAILSIKNNISPMTRQVINKKNLILNRNLKDAIERFKSSKTLLSASFSFPHKTSVSGVSPGCANRSPTAVPPSSPMGLSNSLTDL